MIAFWICVAIYSVVNALVPLGCYIVYDELHYTGWWNNGSPALEHITIIGHILFHLLLLPYLLILYFCMFIKFIVTGGKR